MAQPAGEFKPRGSGVDLPSPRTAALRGGGGDGTMRRRPRGHSGVRAGREIQGGVAMSGWPEARSGLLSIVLCVAALGFGIGAHAQDGPSPDAGAIVVGAGISGLSAAVEMGRAGVPVVVVDMNSVGGGHAVLAGGVAIVGTPLQEAGGFKDSPDLAYRDWSAWTEDGDPEWTRYYVENSRAEIFDWVTEMGVEFVRVIPAHGNSVPRFHFTRGRATHLVVPMLRTALKLENIDFIWNSKAESLVMEDGRVVGVTVRDTREDTTRVLRAPHVILATGGFQSNLDRVRETWRADLPFPDRLLIGSAINATGSGHDMAAGAGAQFAHLDRHYTYFDGLPDPRDPEGRRGLTAGNASAIWVNAQGRRFVNETGLDKYMLAAVLGQKPATYWLIFDHAARPDFGVRGATWLKFAADDYHILDDPSVATSASTLAELAAGAGLPGAALAATVRRFNELVAAGEDADFGRFGMGRAAPPIIAEPPFYAVQLFPQTRKNMGGVVIDKSARVLDAAGRVIPGLYAVGELTGMVGINGSHGLDGTFLGPSIMTGRIAGRTVAAAWAAGPERSTAVPLKAVRSPGGDVVWRASLTAADLASLLARPRPGFWHFETSHAVVLERRDDCAMCHSARLPFAPPRDRRATLAQTEVCTNCH